MIVSSILRPALSASAAIFSTTAAGWALWRLDCQAGLWFYDWRRQRQNRQGNPQTMDSKSAWIVGASSGIGQELAFQLVDEGISYLVLSSRSKSKLDAVAEQCRLRSSATSFKVKVLPMDVTIESDLSTVTDILKGSNLDLVVLNAGQGHCSLALETSSTTALQVLQTNAIWPILLAPLLPQVLNNTSPHLVVTTSVGGVLPLPLSAVYAASKHCVQGYFESLRAERPDMRIDLIMPGTVDTAFHTSTLKDQENPLERQTKDAQVTQVQDTSGNAPDASPSSGSAMKMPVQRCVQLMVSSILRPSQQTVWITRQPVLTALAVRGILPSSLFNWVMAQAAQKRIAIFRAGKDLYDPNSWLDSNKPKE